MTLYLRLCAVVGIITLVLSGCASSGSVSNAGSSLEDLQRLQATLDQSGAGPTAEQYQSVRQRFVGSMQGILMQQARAARSPARKIKNAITLSGVVLGLGGTIASFVIKDEDTRATIAQASSGVAGVSGIISLLPFGSKSAAAGAVGAYLSAEMPLFEARWPAAFDRPMTVAEWGSFTHDVEHMTGLIEELSQ